MSNQTEADKLRDRLKDKLLNDIDCKRSDIGDLKKDLDKLEKELIEITPLSKATTADGVEITIGSTIYFLSYKFRGTDDKQDGQYEIL